MFKYLRNQKVCEIHACWQVTQACLGVSCPSCWQAPVALGVYLGTLPLPWAAATVPHMRAKVRLPGSSPLSYAHSWVSLGEQWGWCQSRSLSDSTAHFRPRT